MTGKKGDKGYFSRWNRARSDVNQVNEGPILVETAGYRTLAQMVAELEAAGQQIITTRRQMYANKQQ